MGQLTINSSALQISYEFRTDKVIIKGNYRKDSESDSLLNVNGNISLVDSGENIGNFSGYFQNYKLYYSLDNVPSDQLLTFTESIQELEEAININNNNVE